jgi:hypothetical protein
MLIPKKFSGLNIKFNVFTMSVAGVVNVKSAEYDISNKNLSVNIDEVANLSMLNVKKSEPVNKN